MTKKIELEELRVAADTNVGKLAGAIVSIINKGAKCELTAVGASACNQAMKAVARANGFLGPNGISLVVKPCFITLDLSGEKREGQEAKSEVTALKFKVEVDG